MAPIRDTPRDVAGTTPEVVSPGPATNATAFIYFRPPCCLLRL